MKITISGEAGSGKSTVAKLLAKKLHLKHFSIGDLWRELAVKKKISLKRLIRQAEFSPKLDNKMDLELEKLGQKKDDFIIDSRLGFHFIPDSIKIFLNASLDEAAMRILNDKTSLRKVESIRNLEQAKRSIKRRKQSEIERYWKYYKINPYVLSNYDIVIDTTNIPPEKVVDAILKAIKKL